MENKLEEQEKKKEKKKRLKLHELPQLEDIRYRGVFSFQSFQLIGWLCIWIGQVTAVIGLAMRLAPGEAQGLMTPALVGMNVANMALPFLLIANFAIILGNPEKIRLQIAKHGAAMLGIAALYILGTRRYLTGSFVILGETPEKAAEATENILSQLGRSGYFDFNIFVDLFLCSTFMFFLDYRPARVFTGKRLIIFRLFSLLPLAYEVGCQTLKAMAIRGGFRIPSAAYPFLTVKPPMTFVVFMVLTFHMKIRERRFCRGGRTWDEYRQFLRTRRNSWHFSRYLAVVLLLAAILDLVLLTVGALMEEGSAPDPAFVPTALRIGFGGSLYLAFLAPFVLLFSYNRAPKYRWISIVIPIAVIGLIALTYVEAAYQFLGYLKRPSLDALAGVSDLIETLP